MKKVISILLIALVSNNIFLENAKFKESIILQSNGNIIMEGTKYLNEIIEIIHEIDKKIIEYIFKKNDEIYNTLKDKAFAYLNITCSKKSIAEIKSDMLRYFPEIIKEIRNNIEKYPKIFEEEKNKYFNHINETKFSNSTVQNDFINIINSFSEDFERSIIEFKKLINDFLHFDEKRMIEKIFNFFEERKYKDKNVLKNQFFREIRSVNEYHFEKRERLIKGFCRIRSDFEYIKFSHGIIQFELDKYIHGWRLEKVYEIITYLSNIEPEKIIEIFKYTVETIKNIFKRKEINEFINLFNRVMNIPKEYICKELINILQVFVKDIVSGEYFINYDFEKIYKKINEILKWGISYFKSIKSEKDFYKEFQKYLPDIRETILTFNIHQYIHYNENNVKKALSIMNDYLKLYIYSIYYVFQQYLKI